MATSILPTAAPKPAVMKTPTSLQPVKPVSWNQTTFRTIKPSNVKPNLSYPGMLAFYEKWKPLLTDFYLNYPKNDKAAYGLSFVQWGAPETKLREPIIAYILWQIEQEKAKQIAEIRNYWKQADKSNYSNNCYAVTINGLMPLPYNFTKAIDFCRVNYDRIPKPKYLTDAEILSMPVANIIQLFYQLRQYLYHADNPDYKEYTRCTKFNPSVFSASIPLERTGFPRPHLNDDCRERTEIELQKRIYRLRTDLHKIYDPEKKQWIDGLIDFSDKVLRGSCPKEMSDVIGEAIGDVFLVVFTAGLGTIGLVAKYAIQAARLAADIAKTVADKQEAKRMEKTAEQAVYGAEAILRNRTKLDDLEIQWKALLTQQVYLEQAGFNNGLFMVKNYYPETGVSGSLLVVSRNPATGELMTIPIKRGVAPMPVKQFLALNRISNNLPNTIQLTTNNGQLTIYPNTFNFLQQGSCEVVMQQPTIESGVIEKTGISSEGYGNRFWPIKTYMKVLNPPVEPVKKPSVENIKKNFQLLQAIVNGSTTPVINGNLNNLPANTSNVKPVLHSPPVEDNSVLWWILIGLTIL